MAARKDQSFTVDFTRQFTVGDDGTREGDCADEDAEEDLDIVDNLIRMCWQIRRV